MLKYKKTLNNLVSSSHSVNDTKNFHSKYSKYDQLNEVIRKTKAFSGFLEPPVSFLPTFKYSKRSALYDINSKSSRCPSWTDRVLYFFKSNNLYSDDDRQPGGILRPEAYYSVQDCHHGDHRPVCATFKFQIGINEGF